MTWLVLSVLASTLLALVAGWGEAARQNRLVAMAWNYAAAGVLSGGAAWLAGPAGPDGFTLALGAVAGLSYAAALLFWMAAIPLAGLGVSTTAMRLSVVWPVLAAMVFYGEFPRPLQWTGLGLALGATGLLLLAGGRLGRGAAPRALAWLAALWVSSGANAVLLKVFTATGQPAQRPAFLASIFILAGVVCWGAVAWRREPLRRGDALRGTLFGVLNVIANAALLNALERLPAVIVFPVRDAGIIAAVSLAGVLLLGERPGLRGWAAIAAAALAVALMSL